jgi:hypothetical protein
MCESFAVAVFSLFLLGFPTDIPFMSSLMFRFFLSIKSAAVLRVGVAATLAVCVLTACSPAYDWRTNSNDADGYTVDLPAKPMLDERDVVIGGTTMKMKMQLARVEGVIFAVGTVLLQSDDPKLRQTVLDNLRIGLARNLDAVPDIHATQVPLAMGAKVDGVEINVSGNASAKQGAKPQHRRVQARLVARGRHVYQVMIVSGKALPQEQTDQFFQSFKLY